MSITFEQLHLFCTDLGNVEESFPFDEDTLVLKVCGKIFAIIGIDPPLSINVKCDPEKAIELREQYEFVQPAYHMNKKHWNTIIVQDAPFHLLKEWIQDSYHLIVSKHKPK